MNRSAHSFYLTVLYIFTSLNPNYPFALFSAYSLIVFLWVCLLRFNSTSSFSFAERLCVCEVRLQLQQHVTRHPDTSNFVQHPALLFSQLLPERMFSGFSEDDKSERRWNSLQSAASHYMNAEKHYSLGQLLSASGPAQSRAGACPWSDWCRGPSD